MTCLWLNLTESAQEIYDLIEPVEEHEEKTKRIRVTPDLTPQDVVKLILADETFFCRR